MRTLVRIVRFLLGKDGPRGTCTSDTCPYRWVVHDLQLHDVGIIPK
jgi:hypothetical protein